MLKYNVQVLKQERKKKKKKRNQHLLIFSQNSMPLNMLQFLTIPPKVLIAYNNLSNYLTFLEGISSITVRVFRHRKVFRTSQVRKKDDMPSLINKNATVGTLSGISVDKKHSTMCCYWGKKSFSW